MTTRQILPREITDREAAFFQENGWVQLEQLISPEDAEAMLVRIKALMGVDANTSEHPAGDAAGRNTFFHTYEPLAVVQQTGDVSDRMFYDFSHSVEFGRAAAKLIGETVRYWVDGALVKMPAQAGGTGSGPTSWHQDVGAWETSPFSTRASGSMQFWFPLTDTPHQRGTMRFVGANRQNDTVREILKQYENDPVASYPILEQLGAISPALDLKPGDALVHASSTMHSAYPNSTKDPRWVYINSLFPAAANFTGHPFWAVNDVDGMEVGKQFPDHRFPVIG